MRCNFEVFEDNQHSHTQYNVFLKETNESFTPNNSNVVPSQTEMDLFQKEQDNSTTESPQNDLNKVESKKENKEPALAGK